MKKAILALALGFIFTVSCTKTSTTESEINIPEDETASIVYRRCGSSEVLADHLRKDPTLQARMNAIEEVTARFERNIGNQRLVNGVYEIPVVFNIIYNKASSTISDAQIKSQIDVLNEDYAGSNADYDKTPEVFKAARAGATGIKFVFSATKRKKSSVRVWYYDGHKMKSSLTGGIDPTSPTTNLNIWVVEKLQNNSIEKIDLLGYAQFPGDKIETDGVVLLHSATGRTGSAAYPFGKGRTATHEVGHWLNLRHIWGDGQCATDYVDDTPIHTSDNGGCPAFPKNSTCGGTTHPMMTMNYMDYTFDECLYMFSSGQKTRMLATFQTGGGRNSFAQP